MVALQALAMYSEQTAGNNLDMRVKLSSEVDGDWKPAPVRITSDNALLRRQFDVRIVIKILGSYEAIDNRGSTLSGNFVGLSLRCFVIVVENWFFLFNRFDALVKPIGALAFACGMWSP